MIVLNSIKSFSKKNYAVLIILLFSINSFASKLNPPQFFKSFCQSYDTVGFYKNIYELESNYEAYNHPTVLETLLKCEKLSNILTVNQLSRLYFVIKKHYDFNGNKALSFDYALKLYKLLIDKQENENILWILIDIGNIFYEGDDFENALKYYNNAEEVAILKKQYHALAVINVNYGLIDVEKGKFEKALFYLRKSNSYRFKAENIKMIADNYLKMAAIYLKMKQPDSCLFFIQKAQYYYNHEGSTTVSLNEIPCKINAVYAKLYFYKKDYRLALTYIQKAKEYCRKKNLILKYIDYVYVETDIYLAQKRQTEAINCLNELLVLLRNEDFNDEHVVIYKLLGTIYFSKGDFFNANIAYTKYIEVEKNRENSNVNSKLNLIKSVSEMYENNLKIQDSKEKLDFEKMSYQLNINEKSTSILVIIISAITFFAFCILLWTQRNRKLQLGILHRKIVDQNIEINESSRELEKSNYLKDKIFSIIAHDLRNPLNRLLVELAILKSSSNDYAQIRRMESSLKETIELFEGLLEWSKLDGKKNTYNPIKINLQACFANTVKFYEPEILNKGITVQMDLKANFVFADLHIIQILFRNLVSNGIMFATKNEERKVIEFKSRQINAKTVEIYISNSGPAFSQELISEFYTQNESEISKSSGLGLSICRLLAKLCGWKIEIGNVSDFMGAFLTIQIPVFDSDQHTDKLNFNEFHIEDDYREKLLAFKKYKFYQITHIRRLIKQFEMIEDAQVKLWLEQVTLVVNEGDEIEFLILLSMLDT